MANSKELHEEANEKKQEAEKTEAKALREEAREKNEEAEQKEKNSSS